MMHFDESMRLIEDLHIGHRRTQKRYLLDTLGFHLAEDIVANYNSPEAPTAAMDGYAVREADLVKGRLRIISQTPAGSEVAASVDEGTAIKTFTGSLMPEGADTLIPIENVRVEGDEIEIVQGVPKGFAVRSIGENFAKGDRLIAKGEKIGFAQIGVMASLNVVSPPVYQKPRVAILSTGSELLELGEPQHSPAQIRSSNNYILEAIVKRYGGEAIQHGCVKDDKASITAAIAQAAEGADIVVTTGGVSVGDYDFVKDVVEALGFERIFKGVRLKPGQHILFARRGDTFLLGLPGFAYSSTVTALLYLLPLMAKFQDADSPLRIVQGVLDEPFVKRAKKAEFTACNVRLDEKGVYRVDFKGKKVGSSAILTNMLGNTALLYTTEEESSKEAGERVKLLLLD